MAVRRIVTNLAAPDPAAADRTVSGGQGGDGSRPLPQPAPPRDRSIGGRARGGTRVPARWVEVDDPGDGLSCAKARDAAITDGPADEPWGLRRFCVTDPAGHLVNILGHAIAAR